VSRNRRQQLPPDDTGESANRVWLSGKLLARGALRHTPAGVPVVEFSLGHQSRQEEAGGMRQVECELTCVSVGATAGLLAAARLGGQLKITGFFAAKSLKSRTPVLHVKEIEFLEGNENGIQT
jgi:primosomal replication protein N